MQQLMKKITLLLLFGFFSISVFAQRPDRPNREQLEAARIAFMTTRLDLTPDQAQVFWPIYNEFNQERNNKLRKISKLSDDKTDISEEEAKSLIQERFSIQRTLIEDEMTFVDEVSAVLSYGQILQLNQVNKDFTREIMKRQRQRQGNR